MKYNRIIPITALLFTSCAPHVNHIDNSKLFESNSPYAKVSFPNDSCLIDCEYDCPITLSVETLKNEITYDISFISINRRLPDYNVSSKYIIQQNGYYNSGNIFLNMPFYPSLFFEKYFDDSLSSLNFVDNASTIKSNFRFQLSSTNTNYYIYDNGDFIKEEEKGVFSICDQKAQLQYYVLEWLDQYEKVSNYMRLFETIQFENEIILEYQKTKIIIDNLLDYCFVSHDLSSPILNERFVNQKTVDYNTLISITLSNDATYYLTKNNNLIRIFNHYNHYTGSSFYTFTNISIIDIFYHMFDFNSLIGLFKK